MPPKRSSSLPTLPGPSPFARPLTFCTVEVQKRRLVREAVKTGTVKKLSAGRLPFVAFERGIEWERPGSMAMLPPDELPSLKKILKSISNEIRGLDMGTEGKSSAFSTLELSKSSAFGGFPHYRGGPGLPRHQSKGKVEKKVEMERVVSDPQPSEAITSSAPIKQNSKQKSSKASSKAHKNSKEKEQPATAESEVQSASSSEEDSSDDDASEESDSDDFGSSDGEGSQKATEQEEKDRAAATKRNRRGSVAELAMAQLIGSATEEDGEVENEFDLPFPWTDDELRATFGKFDTDSDGEIQTEDLDTILNYMGCAGISGETDEKIKDMTKYATINWEEFQEFLRKYRELDVKRLKAEFIGADSDGNGTLDTQELQDLLLSMGFSATKHTILEALDALQVYDGVIRFKKFEKLREYLRKTEGINKADLDELRALYDRVCETAIVQARAKKKGPDLSKRDIRKELDIESEMPADDIWRITMYLGYSADKQTVERLCAQVDADGSGFISFQELLKLIRRLRDGEFVEIGKVFKRYTDDGNKLHLENMGLALGDLGYCVSEDAIFCILDELGELQHDLQMTREELAMFLRVYRRMEGFTPDEVAEIRTAFDEQYHILRERVKLIAIPDEPGSPKTPKTPKGPKTPATPAASQVFENGRWDAPPIDAALDALRSSRVMRAFGFARSMQQVQGMLDLIDLDGSGKLEFNEFLKLMHRLFREEAMRRRKIFTALDTKRNGNVPVLKLTTAIKMLVGAEPSAELAEEAAQSAGLLLTDAKSSVSRSGFEVFFKHYRTLGVQEIRENACYSLAEVQLLRETFLKYDADKSGTVEKRELARIITEYFPEATKSKEAQREVQLAIKDVDVNHDGVLDFREFLALMRRFDDSRDESDIKLEKNVVEDLQYEQDEVEGYRQIFLANANLVGELSLEMLTDILCRVVDLSPDEQDELGGLVFKVNPDSRQVVRFPHFLRLVKMMTDENYGRVNQSSARILRKATKSNGS